MKVKMLAYRYCGIEKMKIESICINTSPQIPKIARNNEYLNLERL